MPFSRGSHGSLQIYCDNWDLKQFFHSPTETITWFLHFLSDSKMGLTAYVNGAVVTHRNRAWFVQNYEIVVKMDNFDWMIKNWRLMPFLSSVYWVCWRSCGFRLFNKMTNKRKSNVNSFLATETITNFTIWCLWKNICANHDYYYWFKNSFVCLN